MKDTGAAAADHRHGDRELAQCGRHQSGRPRTDPLERRQPQPRRARDHDWRAQGRRDPAEFTAAIRSNPDAAIEMAHLDGGAAVTTREASRAVTFELRPDATYMVVNLAGDNPADWEVAQFTTSGAKRLPRNGVVRFENAGWAAHFAFAAPLKRNARPRAVARALRRNNERQMERLLDFARGVEPQSLITRGAVNYNQVRFPKRGRYVMVCFFEGHNTQGMFRFVRVR